MVPGSLALSVRSFFLYRNYFQIVRVVMYNESPQISDDPGVRGRGGTPRLTISQR
jgi:hypothetical protein